MSKNRPKTYRSYVLVAFDSSKRLPDGGINYVQQAVSEMQGCYPPDDPERGIIPGSVEAVDIRIVPVGNMIDVLLSVLKSQAALQKGTDNASDS